MGKAPELRVGGRVFTANASNLIYLDGAYPGTGMLPYATHPAEVAGVATLHPFVRHIRAPTRRAIDGNRRRRSPDLRRHVRAFKSDAVS